MAEKDYYNKLGVGKSATKEDIKKAYKKLAMQFHPDRAPDDKKKEYEEKFKEISEAASVLGDDKKRQQYDQFGSSAFSGGGAGGSGGSGFEGYDFSDIMSHFRSGSFGNSDDIFEHIFGGGSSGSGRSSRAHRGADLLYELEITLEDAAKNTKKNIELNKLERCAQCSGKGATKFENCHHCQGSGQMKRTQRTPFGIFQQTGPCPYCHGRGELAQDSCKDCGGEGAIRKKKKIEVTIPGGVDEGMRLRVAGEGEIGANNGPSGDLYIEISITEHEYFTREDQNLNITVPISFSQAVLGDDIDVPLIDGTAKLKIPAYTQSETIFRMRGKGLPSVHGHEQGDQMVKVRIDVPKKLSKKQLDLIKQLGEEKPSKSFIEKIFG